MSKLDKMISTLQNKLNKKIELVDAKLKEVDAKLKEVVVEPATDEHAEFKSLIKDVDAFLKKAETKIKGKTGSKSIRQFLKEVKGKMKKMLKDVKDKKLKESADKIVDKINGVLKESAPDGTLENLRDILRDALNASAMFPEEIGGRYIASSWIRYTYADKIVVEYGAKYFALPYAIEEGVVAFGNPVEVEETFIIKEADLKESELIQRGTIEESLDLVNIMSLKESVYDAETGEIEVILIEAGYSETKKREYPIACIQEAAPNFKGLKMYLNHPTRTEEKELPERRLQDWASTITESWAEGGQAKAKVSVHDEFLRERLSDPVFRTNVGLSINTGGKVCYGEKNGQTIQIVEKIVFRTKSGLASVDWVTEAGARGRVSTVLKESITNKNNGGHEMDLKDLTLKQLRESRPELVDAVIKESAVANKDAAAETALKEANNKIAAFEKKETLQGQVKEVATLLKESKLPEAGKTRILESFSNAVVEDLKESVMSAIKKEADYINSFSSKGKISHSAGSEETDSLKEAETGLLESLGIKEEKKDDGGV